MYGELEHGPDCGGLLLYEYEITFGQCRMLAHQYLEVGRCCRCDCHDLIQYEALCGIQVGGTDLCDRINGEFHIGKTDSPVVKLREIDL